MLKTLYQLRIIYRKKNANSLAGYQRFFTIWLLSILLCCHPTGHLSLSILCRSRAESVLYYFTSLGLCESRSLCMDCCRLLLAFWDNSVWLHLWRVFLHVSSDQFTVSTSVSWSCFQFCTHYPVLQCIYVLVCLSDLTEFLESKEKVLFASIFQR